MGTRFLKSGVVVVACLLSLAPGAGIGLASGPDNARVSRDHQAGSYTRYDGTGDATMTACSTGKRSQNEPSVAVNPHNPNIVVAGSNDYCAALVNGDVWSGYYRSTDGGANWQDSLVPGYPADTSAAGLASPTHASCGAAGDPTQSFDRDGRLFYGFICFNRVKPVNGSTYVATYDQDGGHYLRTVLVAQGSPAGQFSSGLFQDKINLAVDQTTGSNSGNIYLAWSRDGGLSFSQPQVIAEFRPFDSTQFSGNGAGDCGDAPLDCPSGLTFSRFASLSAVTADTSGVHVVWNGELANGQSKVFVRSSSDGTNWSPATSIDTNARGHQYMPDIASADGVITVVFYDSRNDAGYAPNLPTGDMADGSNSGGAVDTFVARSSDGGSSWTETRVTSFSSNYNWETHGSRRVGFWGDYIYVSAVHGGVNVAWTDSRDLVPGTDPRDPTATDGFDVLQCNASTLDPCNSQGGLDQNIYAARP